MKKIMSLFLLVALLLSGCHKMVEDEPGLTLYASFYPIYVLSLGVARYAPGVQVHCLTQPQDSCIRSYSLSQMDMLFLSQADALILGGRGLESFASQLENGSLPLLYAMNGLELEGEKQEDGEDHWSGENPWLFLDPQGAQEICRSLCQMLSTLDPGCAEHYARGLESMERKLNSLAREMIIPQGGKVAVMHEGLPYLARAMNLEVCASIPRESAASMGDNELKAAIARLDQSGCQAVLIERQAPQALTDALKEAGFSLALVDTLTDHSQADVETYFTAMEHNARAVRQALGL